MHLMKHYKGVHYLQRFARQVILLFTKRQRPPGSYISLLNVDDKILTKILATRLETILPTTISPEQTRFIKNRQLFLILED